MKKISGLLAGMVAAIMFTASAGAAEVTLTVHHFLSPKSPAHASFIAPWAQRIEEQSKGRIKVEIYPSMSLGGKPPELYRQVRDGAADVVWTLIGYTPGVFPRSEVFELPTVHKGSARATTLAIQDNFSLIAEDFKDLKPILVHVHSGNAIHLREKAVRSVDDVRGLKLRTPSRTGAWMIEAWKAEPVGMPVPALPEALSKGVVDGALVPFEIVLPLKLQDLTRYSVEGADGSRFGTSVFLYAMNKARYEGLPDDLKAIIDANSGKAIADQIGKLWDEIETPGKEAQRKSGGEVIELAGEQMAAFDALAEQVVTRWIKEAEQNGIDGTALVEAARASVAGHSR
ncbi:MAG: TRAP transporter substrate-binding protein [Gammaproteobacteria bacterium]|nr:TRAP transporter substrate-binding protein [Gammaproteobacteria bacterium]